MSFGTSDVIIVEDTGAQLPRFTGEELSAFGLSWVYIDSDVFFIKIFTYKIL